MEIEEENGDLDSSEEYYVEAPKMLRLANYLIDLVGCVLLATLLIFYLDYLGFVSIHERANQNLLVFFIILFYYSFFESIFSRTPGKFITNTRVVMLNGYLPNLNTILLRTLCRMIPFEALSLLLSEVAWHDKFTSTRVVMI